MALVRIQNKPKETGTQSNAAGLTPLYERKASPDLDWKTRFRIIASKASRRNRNPASYSKTEAPIREELLRLGLKESKSFFHERRFLGYYGKKGQPVYYWLDFYIPSLNLGIEADGEIWHTFFDIPRRDRKRDRILKSRYGLKIVRFSSYHTRKKRLKRKLLRIIEKRSSELGTKLLANHLGVSYRKAAC